MTQPIEAADLDVIEVDPGRVGISYSGGGPLVLVELGCAQAFVDACIVPAVITGVSAGAIAGTAHALDPRGGAGIKLARDLLAGVTSSTLKLDLWDEFKRAATQGLHLQSLGDNGPIGPIIRRGITERFGIVDPTVGAIGAEGGAALLIAATDRVRGESYWFPPQTPIDTALVASSAIPGIFPWLVVGSDGGSRTLVDGGVVTNQPLTQLAIQRCGTIFACAVGYGGGSLPPPTNAVDNAINSVWLMIHQTMKLEQAYVEQKMGKAGKIHRIHPPTKLPVHGYNFTAAEVEQVIEESRQLTLEWLRQLGEVRCP